MKTFINRLYSGVKRKTKAMAKRHFRKPQTVMMPTELWEILPAGKPSIDLTYDALMDQVVAAHEGGVPLGALRAILVRVLKNKSVHQKTRKNFAAGFCNISHDAQEVDQTLTVLEATAFEALPASITKLVRNLPVTSDACDVLIRLVKSPKGASFSVQKALEALSRLTQEDHDVNVPVADLRSVVLQTLRQPDLPPSRDVAIARTFCALPHHPNEALATMRALEGVITPKALVGPFRMLIARLDLQADNDPAILTELILNPQVEVASTTRLLKLILDAGSLPPEALIAAVRDGRPMTINGYSQLLHWLRRENRAADVEAVLVHARASFPSVSAFVFMQIAQTADGARVGNIETLIGNVTHNRSFQRHLETIYGDYAPLVPALKRDTHDTLFAPEQNGGTTMPADQADVLAGTAALLVTQMTRLAGLKFGEPRETTALHDWGSAHFADWQVRSAPVANTARLLFRHRS